MWPIEVTWVEVWSGVEGPGKGYRGCVVGGWRMVSQCRVSVTWVRTWEFATLCFHFSSLYVVTSLFSSAGWRPNKNTSNSGPQTGCTTCFVHCLHPTSELTAGRLLLSQKKQKKKQLKGESTERPCPNPPCDLLWSPEARCDRRLKGSQACAVGGRHHLSLKMAVHSGHRLCKIHSTCTFTHSIHWVV